jgi:hypothetical protein
MEKEISALLDRRKDMTLLEAQYDGFEEKLVLLINSCLKSITTVSKERTFEDGAFDCLGRWYAAKALAVLRKLLAPWAHVQLYQGTFCPAVVQLRHLEDKTLFLPCRYSSLGDRSLKKMLDVMVWNR